MKINNKKIIQYTRNGSYLLNLKGNHRGISSVVISVEEKIIGWKNRVFLQHMTIE